MSSKAAKDAIWIEAWARDYAALGVLGFLFATLILGKIVHDIFQKRGKFCGKFSSAKVFSIIVLIFLLALLPRRGCDPPLRAGGADWDRLVHLHGQTRRAHGQ